MEKPRYKVEYLEHIQETISTFPQNIQKRIKDAIEERLTTAPNEYGEPLLREWRSHRRIRVGDYRVIYRVYEEKVLVLIVEIDYRNFVYK